MHRSSFMSDTVRRLESGSLSAPRTGLTVKRELQRFPKRSRVLLAACLGLLLGCAESTGPTPMGSNEHPGGPSLIVRNLGGSEEAPGTTIHDGGISMTDHQPATKLVKRHSNYAVAF